MSIATAILLLSACGSASRTMVVDASIEQIVVQCVIGGVRDVSDYGMVRGEVRARIERLREIAGTLTLRIDGQPRTGIFAWAAAAARVAGYATDRRAAGSVEYAYWLRVRGLVVERRTRITDGRVVLTTDVYGSIGPRGELYHVSLVLRATESTTEGTTITGSAMGETTIGSRCRIVRHIAERAIADALDRELLGRIQRGGIDLYRAGAIVEALK